MMVSQAIDSESMYQSYQSAPYVIRLSEYFCEFILKIFKL